MSEGRTIKVFMPRQRWMDDGIAREALYALRNIGEDTGRPVAVSHFENDPHDVELELADPGGAVGPGTAQWLDDEKLRVIPAMTADGFDAKITGRLVLDALAVRLGKWCGAPERDADPADPAADWPSGQTLELEMPGLDDGMSTRALRQLVLLECVKGLAPGTVDRVTVAHPYGWRKMVQDAARDANDCADAIVDEYERREVARAEAAGAAGGGE